MTFDNAINECADFWYEVASADPDPKWGFAHSADRPLLSGSLSRVITKTNTIQDFLNRPEQRSRLHLMVPPEPYCGDLRTAKVIILQINPRVSEVSFLREKCSAFRDRWSQTLAQKFDSSTKFPFEPLDPTTESFAIGGFSWWHAKLQSTVEYVWKARRKEKGDCYSYLDALSEVSKQVAAIDLIPYYSFPAPQHKDVLKLPSVDLAMKLAKSIPRSGSDGKRILVATAHKIWAPVFCEDPIGVRLIKTTRTIRAGIGSAIGDEILTSLGIPLATAVSKTDA